MRMRDRILRDRSAARAGYNEMFYTGAVQVSSSDVRGRDREGNLPQLVRRAREAMTENGPVFGCIVARMGLIAEARFKFQRFTDNSLFGDPALRLLEHPWPGGDSGALLSEVEQDGGCISGSAYVRRIDPREGGDPLLTVMRPDTVTIVSEERNDTVGRPYKVPIGFMQDVHAAYGIDADPQFYTTDEVAHFRPVKDPFANYRGYSWISALMNEIRADQAMTTYKISHLNQGAFPGMIIKSSRKMGPIAIEVLRKRLNTRYGGPDNAGRTVVLDEGQDATVVGHSLEQIQSDLVTKIGERRIAMAAQVPLEVLGLVAGDYMAAVRRMADLWARQEWHRICASLEHLLPPLAAGNTVADPVTPVRLWYDVSGIAALREGELQRGQTYLVKAQGLAASIMAGMERKSAIAAADAGDISLLVPDPNAPTPGMAGRVTESEKFAAGQQGGAATAAPAGPGGGVLNGRAPQAALPQALPGAVKPNLPNALPGSQSKGVPAIAGGARGAGGGIRARRADDLAESNGYHDIEVYRLMSGQAVLLPRPVDDDDPEAV